MNAENSLSDSKRGSYSRGSAAGFESTLVVAVSVSFSLVLSRMWDRLLKNAEEVFSAKFFLNRYISIQKNLELII